MIEPAGQITPGERGDMFATRSPFVKRGHFRFESGDHGDTALSLDLLFVDAHRFQKMAGQLAASLRAYRPDVICGPLIGGAFVAQAIAYDLGSMFAYSVKRPDAAEPARYDMPPALQSALSGARVAVVDDAINAGSATLATIRSVEECGGLVVAVGCLLVQGPGGLERWAARKLPIAYLAEFERHLWPSDACPLCRAGLPIDPLS